MANKTEELVGGLVEIHKVRDAVAKFLAANERAFDDLVECCEKNNWEDGVAYDLRAAMFQLGCVLSTLVLWDAEVLPENREQADQIVARIRKVEEQYAGQNR